LIFLQLTAGGPCTLSNLGGAMTSKMMGI